MRKFLFFLISLGIGVILFIWVLKFVGWTEIKNAFSVFTGWQGAVIFGLTFIIVLIGIWEWQVILKGEGVNISFRELFRPYLAGYSILYLASLVLVGKEAFRSYALKRKNSVPWPKGIASTVIDRILDFTIELMFIFLGIIFFLLLVGFPSKNLAIIFGGVVFLVSVAGIIFSYFKISKRESVIKYFIGIFIPKYRIDHTPLRVEYEIFNFFKIRKKYMWQGFGLTFLEKLVKLLRTWLLILFLGKKITLLPAVSILGFSYLAMMIPIPANLGSYEAIQILVFNNLGLGANIGAAFTMICRGAELIIALLGAFFFFRLGARLLGESFLKQNNNTE